MQMKATFDTKFTLQYATHCSDVFDLVYFYFSDRSGYTHTQLTVSGKDVAKC